jgi:alkylation response protein AidB-like acyl-CoA dehydrogenase
MDLLPSSEQTEIIDSSAAFLRDRLPVARTRELIRDGVSIDTDAWSAAAELGWFALGLPEALGGVGCGLADEALLLREIGRSLASGPFLASILAARVASFGGRSDVADEIVAGRPVGLVAPDRLDAVDEGGRLHGDVQLLDAVDGLALVITPLTAAIVDVDQLTDVVTVRCFDPAVSLQRARAASVAPIVSVDAATDPIERRALVLAAAMLTGITEAVRDLASEHAKQRVQFDRPIGVNQAIKHPCADMAVRAQLALAQTLFAALATDELRDDADFHALSALLVASEAAELSTAANIQVHGGMGVTFEHDSHLYMKRARVLSLLFGGDATQLARLLVLDPPR